MEGEVEGTEINSLGTGHTRVYISSPEFAMT